MKLALGVVVGFLFSTAAGSLAGLYHDDPFSAEESPA
jgi:uncharacterized protein involved in cysteine biosynthesis